MARVADAAQLAYSDARPKVECFRKPLYMVKTDPQVAVVAMRAELHPVIGSARKVGTLSAVSESQARRTSSRRP